jgi:drug/metabolite transporter (DMT)-like permease
MSASSRLSQVRLGSPVSSVAVSSPEVHVHVQRVRFVLALAAVWLLWGSTYLAMRFAVAALPPFFMGGSRFAVAGATLLFLARARGEPLPDLRTWLVALPVGALLFLCGNGLVAVAEQELPSSLAAVVCATMPLIASGLSAIRGERPTRGELVGMLLGFAGVAVLGLDSPLAGAGLRALSILFAPIAFAAGSLLARAESARQTARDHGLGASGTYMLAGGVWMLLASALLGERVGSSLPWQSVVAWAYLVTFGSLVGFSAYSWLLAHARPAVAMSYAYVNPVIAVLLGAALGGEALGWGTLGATVLIGGGVMVSVVLGKGVRSKA